MHTSTTTTPAETTSRSTPARLRRTALAAVVAVLATACAPATDPQEPTAAPAQDATTGADDTAAPDDGTDTDDQSTDTDDQSTETDDTDGGVETVTFSVVDHGFEGLPDEVGPATRLAFENRGAEFYQVAVHRLADEDTRTVEQLASLPLDTGAQDAIGNGDLADLDGTPVGGISAPPGAPGRVFSGGALGATFLVLDAPGRYLVIATLPVGLPVPTAIEAENSQDYSALTEGPFQYQEGAIAVVEVVG